MSGQTDKAYKHADRNTLHPNRRENNYRNCNMTDLSVYTLYDGYHLRNIVAAACMTIVE